MNCVKNVDLTPDGVVIIDQSRLPNEKIYLTLNHEQELFEAIKSLRVRGAPAIGIFAGFALYTLARQLPEENFPAALQQKADYLNSSRPTAINLSWALGRVMEVARANAEKPRDVRLALIEAEARAIQREDIDMCRAISENGLTLLKNCGTVLTHCNAGPLATSEYGTALGPILLAKERGIDVRVFAGETRPLLQGARLTAYELQKAGVDVTLICDNMAAQVMKNGWIDAVFVGCDRVAANGDVANKIGTSGLAVLARHYGVPFYVLGPGSTIDPDCKNGADIEIELRDGREIGELFYEKPMAPEGISYYNPAFDVTDAGLISGIVTEKGIFTPPYDFSRR